MSSNYDQLEKKIPSDGSKKDSQIAELQSEVEGLRNCRNEDRFLFGLIILILLDVNFFTHMDGWGAPVAILLLEFIVVILMAKRQGVEEIVNMIDKYLLCYLQKPQK